MASDPKVTVLVPGEELDAELAAETGVLLEDEDED